MVTKTEVYWIRESETIWNSKREICGDWVRCFGLETKSSTPLTEDLIKSSLYNDCRSKSVPIKFLDLGRSLKAI